MNMLFEVFAELGLHVLIESGWMRSILAVLLLLAALVGVWYLLML